MKRNFLQAMVAAGVLGVVINGCEVNPFSPPDKAKPGESSSSSSGSGMSSSSSGDGGMAGAGGGNAGAGGSGGSCVCMDDGNVCTSDVAGNCPNGDPLACHTIKFAETCPAGRCDDKGQCVDCLACTDAACVDRCNGVDCTAATECKSGFCEQANCCDAACAGPCRACDKAGLEGTCQRMPLGLQLPECDGTMICGSDGNCMTRTKAALGALCNDSSQCQSGLCRREYCQSAAGEPCVEDLECDTNLCDPTTKTCKACTATTDCPAGSDCNAGTCKVFLGQPAGTDAECAMGTVIQFLCTLGPATGGAACNAHHECVSRNCQNNLCTPLCTNAAQCPDGGPCTNGICAMAAGNYCIVDAQCKSGMCRGFPRKCL